MTTDDGLGFGNWTHGHVLFKHPTCLQHPTWDMFKPTRNFWVHPVIYSFLSASSLIAVKMHQKLHRFERHISKISCPY